MRLEAERESDAGGSVGPGKGSEVEGDPSVSRLRRNGRNEPWDEDSSKVPLGRPLTRAMRPSSSLRVGARTDRGCALPDPAIVHGASAALPSANVRGA